MKTFFLLIIFAFVGPISTDALAQRKIVKVKITNEIPGSSYRKRGLEYFIVNKGDTSLFKPIFYETNKGETCLHLHQSYNNKKIPYAIQLSELKELMSEASQEFKMDKFKSINIGRLFLLGDIAIETTHEYTIKNGTDKVIELRDYPKIISFLESSTLVKDYNQLLKPYSLVIDSIHIEKVYFTDKKYLIKYSNLQTHQDKIPKDILDMNIWFTIKKL